MDLLANCTQGQRLRAPLDEQEWLTRERLVDDPQEVRRRWWQRTRRMPAPGAGAETEGGLHIARALLEAKLDGQAAVADRLGEPGTAKTIEALSARLREAETVRACRDIEADAANTYFAACARTARCAFAERDLARIPDHWTSFAARTSPLHRGKSPRGAADPINALLNYGYGLAEAEWRLAILAVGLDPGLGIAHSDARGRDSLALDLVEVLRAIVDQHALQLLRSRHLSADDFHETRTGECRLLPPLRSSHQELGPSCRGDQGRWSGPHRLVRDFARGSVAPAAGRRHWTLA